ncbi:unnamed protein product [Meganyctiphanes norvegica]|uniref:G-protein coupled receptors family 1 profile domain-containing protein n=1 Tax=Meganyctiphanes norvegica TaxID=48144 RepID=A0AAV2RPN6_MEGNR
MEDPYVVPDEVAAVLKTRFHIVFPVFIVLTIIINAACIMVTMRPKLRAYHCNTYIQLMAILDLLSSFAYLPFIFDNELCLYSSYTYAFYFTHFGWMVTHCLRALSNYVLLFLSYDRFLAIWYPDRFKVIKHKGISRRMFIVGSLLVISYIPVMYIGHVTPQPNNKWLGLAGIKVSNEKWTSFYKPFHFLITCVLPSIMIVGLSMGLIYGIFKKRILGSEGRKRKRQFFQTLAVLVLNITYVICIIPYLAAVMTYNIEKGKCYGPVKSEILILSHTHSFCFGRQ